MGHTCEYLLHALLKSQLSLRELPAPTSSIRDWGGGSADAFLRSHSPRAQNRWGECPADLKGCMQSPQLLIQAPTKATKKSPRMAWDTVLAPAGLDSSPQPSPLPKGQVGHYAVMGHM